MTPPANFSGVPQQPQALPPYGVNPQQQQPVQQQPQVPQQFGNVPANFQGQSPYSTPPATMMRSGRASLEQLQQQIDQLENQPLPAGGNPLLAGAITLGATAALTTGVSEGAYRWGLDTKLAHAKNGTETPAERLTPKREADIRKQVEAAKLDALNEAKVNKHFADHKTIINGIVSDAVNIENAIDKHKRKQGTLSSEYKAQLNALDEPHRLALSKIVDPTATTSLLDLDQKLQELNAATAKTPTGFDTWANELKTAQEKLSFTEQTLTKLFTENYSAIRRLDTAKDLIGMTQILALEQEAFGKKIKRPFREVKYQLDNPAGKRSSWIAKAQEFHNNDQKVGTAGTDYQQKYIQFLEERINERRFREQIGLIEVRVLNATEAADFEKWKQAPGNSRQAIDLQETFKVHQKKLLPLENEVLRIEKEYTLHKNNKNSLNKTIQKLNAPSGKSVGAIENRNHLEHQAKVEQQGKIATLEKEHTAKVQAAEAAHKVDLDTAKGKLQTLKDIQTKQPKALTVEEAVGNKKINPKQVEADAKIKINEEYANQPKGKAVHAPLDLKEAEGFGKAWQNVDELKTKGFTELAEHSSNAKWAGIKAGGLTALIGTGLTIQQFMAAGKAQEASNARDAKIAKLRSQLEQQGA